MSRSRDERLKTERYETGFSVPEVVLIYMSKKGCYVTSANLEHVLDDQPSTIQSAVYRLRSEKLIEPLEKRCCDETLYQLTQLGNLRAGTQLWRMRRKGIRTFAQLPRLKSTHSGAGE